MTRQTVSTLSQVAQDAASRLADDTERQLEAWNEARNEGHEERVLVELRRWKSDQTRWELLPNRLRARVLRMEAMLLIDLTGSLELSGRLLDEALSVFPQDNQALARAILAYQQGRPEEVLALLAMSQDIDSINARAEILLGAGRTTECRQVIDEVGPFAASNVGTLRIGALASLASGDLDKARQGIEKAAERKPRWQSVRYAFAIINYHSSLSPAALPDRLFSLPEPVHPALVGQSEQSRSLREAAAQVFEQLADAHVQQADLRRNYSIWRLACMAVEDGQKEQASQLCTVLLKHDRTDPPVILWAIASDLDVDLKPSMTAIASLENRDQADIPQVLALVTCYLHSGGSGRALKLLRRKKPLFEMEQQEELWTFWFAKSLLSDGKIRPALHMVSGLEATEEVRDLKTQALLALARQNGDWTTVRIHLEESYSQSRNPRFLLNLYQLMAAGNVWDCLVDRADELVRKIGTASALNTAVVAAFRARQFQLCLDLLDKYITLFTHRMPSAELRRIQIQAQQALGVLSEAEVGAAQLVKDDPSTLNILTLAQVLLDKADIRGLAMAVRPLVDRTDLSAVDALRLARVVRLDDKALSVDLWRRTLERGLPDEAVGMAVTLGHELGLVDEVGRVEARMAQLASGGKGGIQVISYGELVSILSRRRQELLKAEESYARGLVPVHALTKRAGLPLVILYHSLLAQNELDQRPLVSPALFVRHGSRLIPDEFPPRAPDWRLHVDATAVLMAAQLGILDRVSRAFGELNISRDTVRALVEMMDSLAPAQPARLEGYRRILDLAARRALHVVDVDVVTTIEDAAWASALDPNWLALLATARRNGGFMVSFSPPPTKADGSPPVLPEEVAANLIDNHGVVEALQRQGRLSKEDAERALLRLGQRRPHSASPAAPPSGSRIYFYGNTCDELANAGVLEVASRHFQVAIEQREIRRVAAELTLENQKGEAQEWLADLVDRIRKGLDAGTYKYIPAQEEEPEELRDAAAKDPTLASLLSIMSFPTRERDVIWVDDRFTTSFSHRIGAPVVGIIEILTALVGAGELDEKTYYSKLNSLRAANVRFIPIEKKDILYHLRQAPVQNGRIVETRELINLRQYAASCLLHGGSMQTTSHLDGAPNPFGEGMFVLSFGRATRESIVDVWGEQVDEEVRRARAEWLLDNLRLDYLALVEVAKLQVSTDSLHRISAIGLAQLISLAVVLSSEGQEGSPSPRKLYLSWLEDCLLYESFGSDPNMVPAVAGLLKQAFADLIDAEGKAGRGIIARSVLRDLHQDIPEVLRDELARDAEFMRSIGIKYLIVVQVGDVLFTVSDFWRAATQAMNGQQAQICPTNSAADVVFEPWEDSGQVGGFSFRHPSSGAAMRVADDTVKLLAESPSRREMLLRSHREWFDCPQEAFEQAVAEIASMTEPRDRVEAARTWRSSSAAIYYDTLSRDLRAKPQFRLSELMPPKAGALLSHLRLGPDSQPEEDFLRHLGQAAKDLSAEEGLYEALVRLVSLPIAVPETLILQLQELDPENLHRLVDRLMSAPRSPVGRFHLTRILVALSDRDPQYEVLAADVVAETLSENGIAEANAFLAILKWAHQEFDYLPGVSVWPAHVRLATVWFHANKLLATFRAVGAPADWLVEMFAVPSRRLGLEPFERNEALRLDLANPRRVDRGNLLLSGVLYGLGSRVNELMDESLRARLEIAAYVTGDNGVSLPMTGLMRDPRLALNGLGSFLSADRDSLLAPIVGMEEATKFSSVGLETNISEAVTALAGNPDDAARWLQLLVFLGDLPAREGVSHPLHDLLSRLDFSQLYRQAPSIGMIAIQVAALQAANFPSTALATRLKEQLVGLARAIGEDGIVAPADGPGDGKASLLDIALHIARATGTSAQEVMTEFTQIVSRLLDAVPSLAHTFRLAIQGLCDGLPTTHVQVLWPLLIRLRAEDREQQHLR